MDISSTVNLEHRGRSPMASISRIVGLTSCAFVLCLGLSAHANADANSSASPETVEKKIAPDPCAERKGGQANLTKCTEEAQMGIETVKGVLLRIDGDTYSVKKYDGKEAALHVDGNTRVYEHVRVGDSIEAKTRMLEGHDRQHTISIKPLEQQKLP